MEKKVKTMEEHASKKAREMEVRLSKSVEKARKKGVAATKDITTKYEKVQNEYENYQIISQ